MISADMLPRLETQRRVAGTAAVVLVGIVYFVLIVVSLHFLHPDLSPISQPISQYAAAAYGFLMTSAFFALSLASFALVLGLARGVALSARSRFGLVLIGLWAVGIVIAMVFPLNPLGAPETISSAIHRSSGPVAFLSLTIGVFLVSRRFKYDDTWRSLYRPALLLSLLLAVAFVATFLSLGLFPESGVGGLSQRLFVASFVTWFLLVAARLRAVGVAQPRPNE